jgi:uncharacterized protein
VRSNDVLIVFVKNVRHGNVKTRIAKTHGNDVAEFIYNELVAECQHLCKNLNVKSHVYYSEEIVENDGWDNIVSEKHVQSKGDLGNKIEEAFSNSLYFHNKVVLIGSDCPYITKVLVEEAFTLLDKVDLVLGPTYDGGYYLVGMTKVLPHIFKDIFWSTDLVLQQTVDKAFENSNSLATLPYLGDIDLYQDYAKWKRL